MKGSRSLGTRGRTIAVAGVLALSGLAMVGPGPATADTAPPPGSGMPATVSSVALPAPQISGGTGGAEGAQGGVVWATDMAGDIAFAGGNFTAATDPGAAAPEARGNLLAFDVTTGVLTDFAPQLNGQVLALAVSPDGGTLYVGGAFTEATVPDGDDADSEPDEVSRRRLAAYDIATGELLAFAPSVNADVAAVVATDDTVYAGGSFLGIGNVDRHYLAAFGTDGTLLPWAPAATGGPVTTITVNPAATKIAVGGYFPALNGSSNPGYGLGMVDATTGANLPMVVNTVVRNGRPTGLDPDDETDGAITALASDGTYIYGTGFTYQSKEGEPSSVFAASWDGGAITWINDCHGDAYDVAAVGDVVYAAGHTHYCENIDGVRQGPGGVGDYPYFRAIATSPNATGVVRWEPDQGRYQNYEGLPAPTMLGWYPSFNAGTFTGQAQGPWTVTGNDEYVVFGGEFTRVDNRANQGLVRFGIGSVPLPTGIDANGPQYFNDAYPIKLTSTETGSVRVSWGTNRDDDNENLTYRVQRRVLGETDVPAPLHTRTVFSRFWNPSTMTWTDTGVTPGTTYEYPRAGTRPRWHRSQLLVDVRHGRHPAGPTSDYVEAVYADEPTTGGASVTRPPSARPAGTATGVEQPPRRREWLAARAGAVGGDPDTAFTFSGAAAGSAAAGDVSVTCTRTTSYEKVPVCWPPDVFTLETWFKTTTTTGGRLVGWSNRATGNSTKSDRQPLHGRRRTDPVRRQAGRPSDRHRQPAWSQRRYVAPRVGTLSPPGCGSTSTARASPPGRRHDRRAPVDRDLAPRWRPTPGVAGSPTSAYFAGSLDEVAVYKTELDSSRIGTHYLEGTGGAADGKSAPDAAFTKMLDGTPARSSPSTVRAPMTPTVARSRPTSGTSVTGRLPPVRGRRRTPTRRDGTTSPSP